MAVASVAPVPESGPALSQRSINLIFGALMLAMFMAVLDQSIVSPALPTIVGDLHGLQNMQWVITAYLLTSTIVIPIYGKLGDLIGRKGLFLFAIAVFVVGSILSGISQNMGELIMFRALQGVGGGGLMISAQAILGDIVSARERGKYMGPMMGVLGIGTVLGPLVGGFFTDDVSWRWCFYVNVPIGIAALVVVSMVMRGAPREVARPKLDVPGIFFIACMSAAVVFLTSWAGTKYDWVSWQVGGLAFGFLVAVGLFIVAERRAAEPIIPLRLFRSRTFSLMSIVGLCTGFAMFGALAYLPTFMQMVKGVSATASGLLLLPLVAGMMIASIGAGALISRTGRYKIFAVVGSGVATVGMVLLSFMSEQTGYVENGLYMFIFGAGIGLLMNTMTLAVQNAAAVRDLGTATSSANYFRQIGQAVGGAVVGSLFASRLATNIAADLPHSVVAKVPATSGLTPAIVHALPAALQADFIHAYATALTPLFLYLAPVLAIAFVLTLVLPELPLRTQSAARAAAAEAKTVVGPVVAIPQRPGLPASLLGGMAGRDQPAGGVQVIHAAERGPSAAARHHKEDVKAPIEWHRGGRNVPVQVHEPTDIPVDTEVRNFPRDRFR
jgi:EmrB/QacA subfamily drug resistance transporter